MACSNHTGTVYRTDICPPSHCPRNQRSICEAGHRVPTEAEIDTAIAGFGRPLTYSRTDDKVIFTGGLTREEYAYLVQTLCFPLIATSVEMQNLYYGSINEGRWTPPKTT
jgi:hypothetical protein